MAKYENVCHTCGGLGREGGCPKCGLTPRKHVTLQSMRLDISADIIPVAYQGNLWERPQLEAGVPAKFVDFDEKLDRVLKEFLSGRLPKFSMFLAAPAKYGKHSYAYSCMQTALVQNLTVAPLFTTSDWRRLYRVSQMNPFYRLYDKYKWDDLISKDVVFMSVDHSDDRFDVISLLKDIYDTRSGFGLPTFVISDFKLNELVPQWGKESYNQIYNANPQRDYNRYPVILHRFE